jgi:hypothetical protein
MAASKNARAGKFRGYMGHHEGDALNTLPKYNYSNGFGWRSHKRNKNAFGTSSIIRKVGGGVRIKVG